MRLAAEWPCVIVDLDGKATQKVLAGNFVCKGSHPAAHGTWTLTGVPPTADLIGGVEHIADASSTDVRFCIRCGRHQ